MSINNRTTLKTRNTGVAAGIDKHVSSPILLGGVPYTPPELKNIFAAQTAALAAADALHTQWIDQVQAERAASKKANTVYRLLRTFLIAQHGPGANAMLNDFGMTAPKIRGAATVKVKADAVVKRKATRAARHTMGTVQRKSVTGASLAAGAAPAPTHAAPVPAAATGTQAAPPPAPLATTPAK